MTRLPLRAWALVVLVLVALLAALPAATAASRPWNDNCRTDCTYRDARKDAAAKADLLSAHVVIGKKAFRVSVHVRNLTSKGSFVFGAGLGGWGNNYIVTKLKKGYKVQYQAISEVDVHPRRPCRSAKVSWNARTNVVKATLPYRCGSSTYSVDQIATGIDFRSGKAKDSMGHVSYKP